MLNISHGFAFLFFVGIKNQFFEALKIGLDALGRVIGHLFPRFLLLTLNSPLYFGRGLQFGVFEMERVFVHVLTVAKIHLVSTSAPFPHTMTVCSSPCDESETVEVRLKTFEGGAVRLATHGCVTKHFASPIDLIKASAPARICEREVEELERSITRAQEPLFIHMLCHAHAAHFTAYIAHLLCERHGVPPSACQSFVQECHILNP